MGTDRDYTICSFLSNKQYDCVYIIQTYGLQLYDIPVLLCFKNGLIDLAYLKDEQWYSTPVCGSDDFSFLQPLLDERLKELEIVKERIRKEKQE
ncbi:MAG: hypothetical protein Q4A56_02440 [Porphyromonadaceae bacterium]|nr:hypothetical protein [Porphyromonadaceae bacterium]